MEIKVDLAEIFGGEEPFLTAEEAVKNEIVRTLTTTIKGKVEKQVAAEVSRVISEELSKAVTEQMPTIINDLLNSEYVMVDRWGDAKGKTTFREQLVKAITEQMVYKKISSASDKNFFTKAVDNVIEENVNNFKKEFDSLVNTEFTKEALAYAVNKLRTKLGLA